MLKKIGLTYELLIAIIIILTTSTQSVGTNSNKYMEVDIQFRAQIILFLMEHYLLQNYQILILQLY